MTINCDSIIWAGCSARRSFRSSSLTVRTSFSTCCCRFSLLLFTVTSWEAFPQEFGYSYSSKLLTPSSVTQLAFPISEWTTTSQFIFCLPMNSTELKLRFHSHIFILLIAVITYAFSISSRFMGLRCLKKGMNFELCSMRDLLCGNAWFLKGAMWTMS